MSSCSAKDGPEDFIWKVTLIICPLSVSLKRKHHRNQQYAQGHQMYKFWRPHSKLLMSLPEWSVYACPWEMLLKLSNSFKTLGLFGWWVILMRFKSKPGVIFQGSLLIVWCLFSGVPGNSLVLWDYQWQNMLVMAKLSNHSSRGWESVIWTNCLPRPFSLESRLLYPKPWSWNVSSQITRQHIC